MSEPISELARRLAAQAEAVCRHYLPNSRREGRYWMVGDIHNTHGRWLFVRLHGPEGGKRAAGKWTEYVAGRVMLRRCDWALSHHRSSASRQHDLSAWGFA